jgi:hypothetical protein
MNGLSFIAREDKPGTCPGPGWQLLCSKGARGERGPSGVRGAQGEKGERASAPSIKAWHIDPAKYIASPVMSDGTCGAPLELRTLLQKFLDDIGGAGQR